MKEAKPTQHKKKRKEPLYSVIDGWNFGIGFWLAFPVTLFIIIPIAVFLLWIILLIFGGLLGALI